MPLVGYKAGQEPLRGFLGCCPDLLCLYQLCHQSPECHSPLWLFEPGIAALNMFSSFSKAPEEGGRKGGGKKIEAVCFLHRFTARSTSHGPSEVLDMVSLLFTYIRLLEGFPEPVAGESWCQWQLRTQGRAAAWASSRVLFVLFLAVRFILCPL